MNKVQKFLEWLPKGEWSYTKYEKEYRDPKFARKRDIIGEYIAQIPYFKLIGLPMSVLMLLIECFPIAVQVIWENRAEVWRDFKSLFKKKGKK